MVRLPREEGRTLRDTDLAVVRDSREGNHEVVPEVVRDNNRHREDTGQRTVVGLFDHHSILHPSVRVVDKAMPWDQVATAEGAGNQQVALPLAAAADRREEDNHS